MPRAWMMMAATKRVRVARAMVTAMRLAGNKEGKCGTGHGVRDEGGMHQRGQWLLRAKKARDGYCHVD
jgi:hypothetical protein